MESVRALLVAHDAAPYPVSLSATDDVDGVSLVMLDADIAGLAEWFVAHDGVLRPDQWSTLESCAADARAVMPRLTDDAWVYFGRLFALAQAMLRRRPGSA